ncbi:DDE-type integrase/transposase/recombinase [Candidatus Bathycorpusculum sp.]|uniref:DDE-type integrase/transposase/recombinase n=1 Tax=Candidatus Bathycorpusculum sp. TaxID=2994959 RepID=UPI00282949E7|nr:DDE-type integrase/transposase/recombinase [Candidatus Termitimicrobium sp.]MCL2431946.1 DDE-type integrase/transposase/recombinase [Candidatus Termitimicrobium sp.]
MVKVKNKRELKWCIEKHAADKITAKYAANKLKMTPRRFKQIYAKYKKTNITPTIGQTLGRPKNQLTQETIEIINQAYQKDHLGAQYLQKIIYAHQKITISKRTIHEVLLKLGYAHHQPNKQKRRAPWIRYERKHSLSMVHTDWHHCANGKYLCTILDDASRKIIAAGEFDNETTKNAIIVLKKAQKECRQWYSIHSILTDHGTQFYANKRDAQGVAEHEYEQYLKEHHIRHILCRVNHPQTNGKLEKFHDLYNNHRFRFESLAEFVDWYNNRPHGAFNLWEAETPNMMFVKKLWPEVWLSMATRQFGW